MSRSAPTAPTASARPIDPRAEQRAMVAMFLAALTLACAHAWSLYQPNTWINRDGRFYTNMNVTLVEDASLEQSGFAHSWYDGNLSWNRDLPASFSNIALGRNGEHWPMHPWMMPVVATPLFFAFGIFATLVFNLLAFSVIAAMGYRFARAYVSSTSAALAVATLLFGTAIHEYAYDYHVDIFLLSLLTAALAAVVTRRGYVLGACVGAVLCLKPTTLLLMPAILVLLAEHGERRTLVRALVAGAVVFGIVGMVNTYMFGAPWRFGYMRVVTVENGEKVIFSDENAFRTPLREGMQRVWRGAWGLDRRMTLIALALPGLVSLLATRSRYALTALATAIVSFLVFSKYHAEGDRFHWPAIALLLPFLGRTFDLLGSLVTKLRAWRPSHFGAPHALAAALLAVAAIGAHVATEPRVLDTVTTTPYGFNAMTVAAQGSYDLRGVDERALRLDDSAGSRVSIGRFGDYLPRASPPAVLTAALFTALLGGPGLVVLHAILAAIAVFFAVKLATRVADPLLAAVIPAGLLLLPLAREAAIVGGPALFAAALGMLGLDLAMRRRWIAGATLGALAAWYGDASWLFALGIAVVAAMDSPAALRRALFGSGLVLLLWGLGHLILIGRPFASPEDFVLVRLGGEIRPFASEVGSLRAGLEALVTSRGSRYLLLLLPLAPFGLFAAARRNGRVAILLASALGSLLVPRILAERIGGTPTFAVALVAVLPLTALFTVLATSIVGWFHRTTRRTHVAVVVVGLAALLAIGLERRVADANAPFHLASYRGLRTAEVILGERIPCDFLPWEHMSWECSHYDRNHRNQVGFALPEGIEVGGVPADLLLLPLGASGQRRLVRWRDVRAAEQLHLRYAVPDGMRGGVQLSVSIDDVEVTSIDVPADAQGTIEERDINTSDWAGSSVTLAIEVRGRANGQNAVAIDGTFHNR